MLTSSGPASSPPKALLPGHVRVPPDFANRYRTAGWWEGRSLGDVFMEAFATHGDREALVGGTERVTYRQLADRSRNVAAGLQRLGLRPLDRVVVHLPNSLEFVYAYFGLQLIGAIPVMALPAHRRSEIEHFVDLGGARAYLHAGRLGDLDTGALAADLQRAHASLEVVVTQAAVSTLAAREAAVGRPSIDPADPAVFLLSGGTTGLPKLIPRTHEDYLHNSRCAGAVNDIGRDDALLVVLPLGHNFPLACPGLQAFLLAGARVVIGEGSGAAANLALVARERVTHLELVPAVLIRWLEDPALAEHDLQSIRIVNTGGQRLQPEVKRRTLDLLPGARVQEVFGMAEGLLCFNRLDDPPQVMVETTGRPVSPGDEIRIVDEDGSEVAPGVTGELLCRGPYTIRGYFQAPAHNAKAFTPDGFYRSGDLVRMHSSGNLVVQGRSKDLINRGGEKISAEEIEDLALGHPAILNIACVPMPDRVLGERICAFAVLRPSASLTLEELSAYLLGRGIAKFKLPERLELLAELPMTRIGKVSKRNLVEMVGNSGRDTG